ncbi:heat shock protein 30-like [Cottoperca gobio]|uniref:Heat shock protein 30-like n=1 Tax=Cottoperca gobio TaxID=56716 RepID=A0A6J2QU97_COTGO|nr:heat shock protein beta-9 [Cottoperca gobio]
MAGKFLNTLALLQLEYKSWDSPTAETESNTKEKTHFNKSTHTLKMLCSHGFQSALSPFIEFYWPVRSLRSEVIPLLHQQALLQRNIQELYSSLMDKLQHKILQETQPFQTSVVLRPTVSYHLEKEGEPFGLTLDTQGFSPEELSVRQEGRKLKVSGKTEKKQEDEKGCYSYRRQEFTQEFELPDGPKPEAVTCYLAPDGKLHIQAADAPCVEEAERERTIRRSSTEKTQQSVCSYTEGRSTQDNPENMD